MAHPEIDKGILILFFSTYLTVLFVFRMSGRYSNQSGSRYSHSRAPRNGGPPSLNGSYLQPGGVKPMDRPSHQMDRPLATSQAIPEIDMTGQPNSLMAMYSQNNEVSYF